MMTSTAERLIECGYTVLPADLHKKTVVGDWGPLQKLRLTIEQFREGVRNLRYNAISVVAGPTSQDLAILKFNKMELFRDFEELVAQKSPGLLSKLVITSTPRRERQVWSKCNVEYPGYIGKHVSYMNDGRTTICWPTLGYEVIYGDIFNLSPISYSEASTLLSCAESVSPNE